MNICICKLCESFSSLPLKLHVIRILTTDRMPRTRFRPLKTSLGVFHWFLLSVCDLRIVLALC